MTNEQFVERGTLDLWDDTMREQRDRIKTLTAERDRLREALWAILACETPNANATVTRMAAIARAALKGESHE